MSGASHPAAGSSRALWLALVVVVGLGAVFWSVFWLQSADSALTRVPILDEEWYLWQAAQVRDGGRADEALVMSPGYPLLVAAGGGRATTPPGILGDHPHGLLAMQALAWLGCGLMVGAVIHGAARRAGLGHRLALGLALATCLLFLLYRPAAIYARTILLELPLAWLVTAALACAVASRPGPFARAIAIGLCLGLAATLRAHVLILLLLFVPICWRAGRTPGRRLAAAAVLLAMALGPVTLAAAHNSRQAGHVAGPSLNAGVNLYLGQVPEAGGLFLTLAGFDQEHDPSGQAYLERRLGRSLAGAAEADQVWLSEARAMITANPGRSLVGWIRKVWLHLQGWEIAQVTPLNAWPEVAPVLRILLVPWALLVAGALTSVVLVLASGARRAGAAAIALPYREVAIWGTALGLLIAVQSIFFVVSRYRLVLAPILVVLLGLGLVTAIAIGRRGDRGGRGPWLAVLVALPAALLLTVPWGLSATRTTWSGLEAFNEARRELVLAEARPDADRRPQVEALLARTCAVVPERSEPWLLRANNLVLAARTPEALQVLSEGAMLAADPAPLERARIGILIETGRLDMAEALVEAYLRDHPNDIDMLHDLVVLQGRRGRWTAASSSARRLQTLAPADHRGWLDLGVALVRLGRSDEAVAVLEDGLRRFPDGVGRDQLAENRRRILEGAATRQK